MSSTSGIRRSLRTAHSDVRAGVTPWARALTAVSRTLVALAAVVVLGVLLPIRPATAMFRLVLFALAAVVVLVLAARAFLRAAPAFDAYLERAEGRFPELRSWLRNALDLETRPDPDTSTELAGALRAETARRLTGVPLSMLRPRFDPRGTALRLMRRRCW